jgi:hypothetical protein
MRGMREGKRDNDGKVDRRRKERNAYVREETARELHRQPIGRKRG